MQSERKCERVHIVEKRLRGCESIEMRLASKLAEKERLEHLSQGISSAFIRPRGSNELSSSTENIAIALEMKNLEIKSEIESLIAENDKVHKLINKIPDEAIRSVMEMRYIGLKSRAEIAETLDKSERWVTDKISRGKKML